MRVVVTGGSGFVGWALVDRLVDLGDEVLCLQRDDAVGAQCVRGELEDLRACERLINEHRPDVVYHLAAQAIVGHAKRDPHATLESNVRGTYNILEAFRRHRTRDAVMVVASSDKAYGEIPFGEQSYKETDPLHGTGPYDVSKSCADLITQSYAATYDLPIGIVRAGNIYGPGDKDRTRIIPSVIADLKAGRVPTIRSDGTPVRDYLYIDDAVTAYRDVARWLVGQRRSAYPFNFSGGEPVSVLKLVRMMMDAVGMKDNPIITRERQYEIQTQVLQCHKAKAVLGWTPKFSLRTGLNQTILAAGLSLNDPDAGVSLSY